MPITAPKLELDADLAQRLETLAKSRDSTPTALIEKAVRDLVSREESRAEINRLTEERWEAYQADGKYISEERADAWFARLEAGEHVDPPEPECD